MHNPMQDRHGASSQGSGVRAAIHDVSSRQAVRVSSHVVAMTRSSIIIRVLDRAMDPAPRRMLPTSERELSIRTVRVHAPIGPSGARGS
jgi:hypothetical protein